MGSRLQNKKLLSHLLVMSAFMVAALFVVVLPKTAFADYHQDDLIDDSLFLKSNTMSQSDIQTFLSTKGSYLASYSSYSGRDSTNVLASQIIYEAAQDYGVNPQVILATMQKEQSLVTAQNPLPSQINYAMGYGCPDSGGCSYPGFYNQVANATWQLRFNYERANGNNTWWNTNTGYACSAPSTYYNNGLYPGNTVGFIDGSGTVYATFTIANAATASLYCYTPHAYSTTSSPPYSGSYNFVTSFENWFGPSTNSHLSYSVIQDPTSVNLYLQTSTPSGNYKYYLPSHAIMQDWGIDSLPVEQVTQAYFNSLTTGPQVSHLVKDDWNNLFIVEGGSLHYIQSSSYAKIWGLDQSTAVQSLGITYSMPSTTWAGRFVRDVSQPTGQIWLVDGGNKRAVSDGNMLYEWGYTPNQLTTVTSAFLDSMPTLSPTSQYVSDGTNHYIVDTNKKFSFASANVENDFAGVQTPSTYNPAVLGYFQTSKTWQFVIDSSNGCWYMLEGGKRHYISNGNLAATWGMYNGKSLTSVSHGLIASMPDGGNLSYVIQTQNPSMYWVIDNGTKRYIPDASTNTAWNGTVTPPVYSTQSIGDLPQGANMTSIINATGSPYTYIMDNGVKRYLSSTSAMQAWDIDASISSTSSQLVGVIPEGSFLGYKVKDASGNGYLMMNDVAYPIDSTFYDAWGINSGTPSVANTTIARYPTGSKIGGFIKINNTPYIISGGNKIPIKSYSDAYPSNSLNGVSLPSDYFNTAPEASYLIKSTDSSDNRVWLMANGTKLLLGGFTEQVSYGYISSGIQPTPLAPSVLNSIPDSTQVFSQLIQTGTSGIKFVNFGYSLGFPDGDTLLNYVGTGQILQVSPSVFNAFKLSRYASRLIVDDHGNYYFMENGYKRPITSGKVLDNYKSYPTSYLEGITMALIPTGAPL